jgi:capsular polysaccharide transport system ATP-binding protein
MTGSPLRFAFNALPCYRDLRHNTEYLDMPVNTYSAGMRARLAFGTCLAVDFDVYLIDEITEVGDERFRRRCAAAFRERLRRSDIILATHNSHTIRQYCDRGAILAGGRLQLFDDIASAFERHRRLVAEPAACDCPA